MGQHVLQRFAAGVVVQHILTIGLGTRETETDDLLLDECVYLCREIVLGSTQHITYQFDDVVLIYTSTVQADGIDSVDSRLRVQPFKDVFQQG